MKGYNFLYQQTMEFKAPGPIKIAIKKEIIGQVSLKNWKKILKIFRKNSLAQIKFK